VQHGNPDAVLKDYSGVLTYRFNLHVPAVNTLTKSSIRRDISKRNIFITRTGEEPVLLATIDGNKAGPFLVDIPVPAKNVIEFLNVPIVEQISVEPIVGNMGMNIDLSGANLGMAAGAGCVIS
jgi:hypothetical protein